MCHPSPGVGLLSFMTHMKLNGRSSPVCDLCTRVSLCMHVLKQRGGLADSCCVHISCALIFRSPWDTPGPLLLSVASALSPAVVLPR